MSRLLLILPFATTLSLSACGGEEQVAPSPSERPDEQLQRGEDTGRPRDTDRSEDTGTETWPTASISDCTYVLGTCWFIVCNNDDQCWVDRASSTGPCDCAGWCGESCE